MKHILAVSLSLLLLGVVVASAADLPLTRVVLYSTGVGYFQHQGTVEGDVTVPLSFRVSQINDILKSLVLTDQGGAVGPVTYAPREPLDKALSAFSVNLGDNPSLYDLLLRLRGAEATLAMGRDNWRGLILGVETQELTVKETTEVVEYVNLLTEQGLRSLPLKQVNSIKLTDAKLSGELTAALGAIAASRDVAKRQVELHFSGKGKHQASAGYLLETPVWKTTYRLVLGEKPYLQGWAIVENTTDSDWKNVEMALVSGRPVSFTQNLYEPLYVSRPEVPVSLPVPVAPRLAEGAIEERAREMADGREMAKAEAAPTAPPVPAAAGMRAMARGAGGFGSGAADRLALQASVTAAAEGERVGELFSYEITQPVSIGRQNSAMIPIVATEIGGEKLGLYNAQSNAKHPLHAFRLKNTSGLHLMGGAITVFDGGAYAGDALVDDLSAGDDRLVTYAVDLGTEVVTERDSASAEVSLTIDKGVLFAKRRNALTLTYTLKNRTQQPRTILVEQPIMQGWDLIAPEKPEEKTASYYRFRAEVKPQGAEKLVVKFEQPVVETVMLLQPDVLPRVTLLLQSKVISEQVKAALQEIIKRRAAIADVADQRQKKEARLKQIGEEQDRIRKNMEQLDRNSDLYKQYVAKLTAQEEEFDSTRADIAKLQEQEKKLKDDLDAYIRGLSVS